MPMKISGQNCHARQICHMPRPPNLLSSASTPRPISTPPTTMAAPPAVRRSPADVIITDYHLVPENGLALIDWVRNSPQSDDRMIPIIMLTANSEEDYVIKARDMGVTEFLAKPFHVEGLYRRLVAVIARPRAFVSAESYFGPDRRRRQVPYSGPDRRRTDS